MTKLTMNTMERFWSKVDKTDSCWNWTAGKSGGYGMFKINKKHEGAHRLSYECFKGKIPAGLQIDHLCRNRKCVNPKHLEAVTRKENILRGISPPAQNKVKTHCPHRHEYNEENTYIDSKSKRHCRNCRRIQASKFYYSKKIEVVII